MFQAKNKRTKFTEEKECKKKPAQTQKKKHLK